MNAPNWHNATHYYVNSSRKGSVLQVMSSSLSQVGIKVDQMIFTEIILLLDNSKMTALMGPQHFYLSKIMLPM